MVAPTCNVIIPLVTTVICFLIILQTEAAERENANSFMDAALRMLQGKYKPPMQPIKMHPKAVGLDERILVANIQVQARLEDGYITKIGGLKRAGDAFQTVLPAKDDWDGESSVTEATIEISDIEFNSTIAFNIINIVHRERVQGKIGQIIVFIVLTDNGTTGERNIPYFKIENIDNIDIQLKGPIQALDQIRNVPLKAGLRFIMRTRLKQMLMDMVERAAQSNIRGMIDKNASAKQKT